MALGCLKGTLKNCHMACEAALNSLPSSACFKTLTVLFICKEELLVFTYTHTKWKGVCVFSENSIKQYFSAANRDITQSSSEGVYGWYCFTFKRTQVADSPEVIHLWSVSPACCCSSIYMYFLFLPDSDIQRKRRKNHLLGWLFFFTPEKVRSHL